MSAFIIRASALSQIMGKPRDSGGLTVKQAEDLAKLQAKEKRTEKQTETMQALIIKRDTPEGLSATAKTYCREDYKYKSLNRVPDQIESKYLEKGNRCEGQAINLLNSLYLENYSKHEGRITTDYMTGECDILAPPIIRDTKCSYSIKTFPCIGDKLKEEYYYQMQAYLILYDCEVGYVDFCLVDTPPDIIEKEAYWRAKKNHLDFEEVLEDETRKHTYGDIPIEKRVMSFEVIKDNNIEKRIIEKVIACRKYKGVEL